MFSRRTLTCLVLVLLMVATGAKKFESRPLDREIEIDGEMNEWQGVMTPIQKSGLAIGLVNDGEYLYICLRSSDRDVIRQAIGLGMTLWLEPAGEKDRRFGIRYPVGAADGMPRGRDRGRPDPEQMQAIREESLGFLELLGAGNAAPLRFAIEDAVGIEVRATATAGRLTYELKLPLAATEIAPHALGSSPGGLLSLVIETDPLDLEGMQQQRGGGGGGGGRGGMGGSGRGGMGGGGRDGMGGGGGGGHPSMPDPLKIVAKIRLAEIGDPSAERPER